MNVKHLEVKNFRNIERTTIDPCDGVNIIYGENAQGKTNILESVYLCATSRSHKGAKDREMIRFGEEEAHIKMIYKYIAGIIILTKHRYIFALYSSHKYIIPTIVPTISIYSSTYISSCTFRHPYPFMLGSSNPYDFDLSSLFNQRAKSIATTPNEANIIIGIV